MEKNKTKLLISAIINIITFVIVTAVFFTAFFRTPDPGAQLITTGFALFKYFTVQSNVLYALIALAVGIVQIMMMTGKLKEIPRALVLVKYVATVGVTLTFLTVALYLAPINSQGYFALFKGANFFFHFLVPVTAIVMYFVEGEKMPFKCTLIGMSHFALYGVFYILYNLLHMENGVIQYPYYDWYFIMQNGAFFTVIMVLAMCAMTYLIAFLLWLPINKRRKGK